MTLTIFYLCAACGITTRRDYETMRYIAKNIYTGEIHDQGYDALCRAEDGYAVIAGDDEHAPCIHCGAKPKHVKKTRLTKIATNPDETCDERCKHATGDSCSCACGGAMHGIAHLYKAPATERCTTCHTPFPTGHDACTLCLDSDNTTPHGYWSTMSYGY